MSRVANSPVTVPSGVEIKLSEDQIAVKGSKGNLELNLHPLVEVKLDDGVLTFSARTKAKQSRALSGTFRSLINNMVVGVTNGYEKKLQLNGVGYRAKASGKKLNLTLGFSHPVEFEIPEGITVETPSQTEIVLKGVSKQLVGQTAAEIRSFRPPEPYKGKGVRYMGEHVRRKDAKKK